MAETKDNSKKCPKCGLLNPYSALRCDCGYDFRTCIARESFLSKKEQIRIGLMERLSRDRNPSSKIISLIIAKMKISRLRKRALQFTEDYSRRTSIKQLKEAFNHYKISFHVFKHEITQYSKTSQEKLYKMEKALADAVEFAPGNALLFHECLELLSLCISSLNKDQHPWLNQAIERIGSMWPAMYESYRFVEQARMEGFFGTTLPLMEEKFSVVSVDVQILPEAALPGRPVGKPGLAAVNACTFNPYAWFQLAYEIGMHHNDITYSKKCTEVEQLLYHAQGVAILEEFKK